MRLAVSVVSLFLITIDQKAILVFKRASTDA